MAMSPLQAEDPPRATKRDQEIVLADFETGGTAWVYDGPGRMVTGSTALPPLPESRAYAMITLQGRETTRARLGPPSPLFVPGYVRRIEFWVYGFGDPDELILEVGDINGGVHRLPPIRLVHDGWKKISVPIDPGILQRGVRIVDPTGLYLRGISIRPHGRGKAVLCRIYIDDIRAIIRPFMLRPDPGW